MNEEVDRNDRMLDWIKGAFFGCCLAGAFYLATLAQLKPEADGRFWIFWACSAGLSAIAFAVYLHDMREMKA